MSTTVFRVEVFRDETRAVGGVTVEITAYIDRVPETDMAGPGYLARVPQRMQAPPAGPARERASAGPRYRAARPRAAFAW